MSLGERWVQTLIELAPAVNSVILVLARITIRLHAASRHRSRILEGQIRRSHGVIVSNTQFIFG